jgi:hypothetical protein
MTGRAPPPACGAKTRSGGTCGLRAGWGTSHPGAAHCKLHAGSTPRGELTGQLLLARREAAVMGIPLDIEPHNAILQCILIAAGEVRYASERIGELDPDAGVGPVVTTTRRPMKEPGGGEDPEHPVIETKEESPQLNIWIRVRHQAMDRLVAYSATALKAGVQERQVQIAEQQGQIVAVAIMAILTELGVADRPNVSSIVRRQLALITI